MKTARGDLLYGGFALVLAAFLLTFSLLGGCAHTPTPDPNAATCADVCAHGAEMSCTWATPTPLGTPCVEVCENAAKHVPWNLECLVLADDCGPRVCP